MQYPHTREQSAEILRLAVSFMGRQSAGFGPASFTLWYEHAAGVNPRLSEVLDQRLTRNEPLTDADVVRLYGQHIAIRDAEAIERIQQRLLALLAETSQRVSDTGTHAMQFSDALETHSKQLEQPASEEVIKDIVAELLSETHQMRAVNAALSQQLESSSQEVMTLTHRLEEVQAESLNDPLTGLLNRRGLEHAVTELGSRFEALKNAALLVFDIDFFKQINDSHGHMLGDQVLRTVAEAVRARIKGSDIATRLGGDEFAVLLPDTSIAGALTVAEQIRALVAQKRWRRVDREEQVENITLSVGVAHAGDGERLEALLQRADAALYDAKRGGRNRVFPIGDGEPGT